MKRVVLVTLVLFVVSCNTIIEKPKNLIDEEQMVNMIYDISLLDAMKSQGVSFGTTVTYPTTTQFIKSKYKVDSVTFAKSAQYYAADYKKYKKMYEEVKQRLEEEAKKTNGGKPVTPDPNQGLVK